MNPLEAINGIREALSARQVFGKPIEKDGVTVIPAAVVIGGGGGGGSEAGGEAPGAGVGYGIFARPAGAFEIRDGTVTWHPAIDRTWILIATIPALLALLRLVLARRD